MPAIILTWNPRVWDRWDYAADLERVTAGQTVQTDWSVGRHVNTPRGADAYLYLQGPQPGLVAHAVVDSDRPYLTAHFSDSTKTTNNVDITIDAMLPIDDRVPRVLLEGVVPEVNWAWLPQSGRPVAAGAEAALADLWGEYAPSNDLPGPDDVPGDYPEGGVRTVRVNRYERDARARAACLAHWGTACCVCGTDFGVTYGKIGEGYINVHHLTPVSKMGPGYRVDPVKDLRPLCPNCHAMAHTSDPPLTPTQLARHLRRAQAAHRNDR